MMNEETKARLGPALGKIPSGLYITTAADAGRPLGMLSSFIEQAGFEPPMLSMAVAGERPIRRVIEQSGRFGVNILAKSSSAVMKPFARNDIAEPFAGLELRENAHGLPQLDAAMAFLACRLRGQLDAGDHVLMLGEVVDGEIHDPNAEPMVRIRANGFAY